MTIKTKSADRYVRIPVSTALQVPTGGQFTVITCHYWIVQNGDLLFFRGQSPQCNANQGVAERLAAMGPSAEVRWIEQVFIPIRAPDFEYDVLRGASNEA